MVETNENIERLISRLAKVIKKQRSDIELIGTGTYCAVCKINDKQIVNMYVDKESFKTSSECELHEQKEYFDSVQFREILINSVLKHPAIFIHTRIKHDFTLGVYRFGEIMDGTVRDLVKKEPFNKNMFDKLLSDMLSALKHIHSLGFIHSDVKPDNILYTRDKKGDLVFKLCDFNIFQIATHSKYPFEKHKIFATETYSLETDFKDVSVDIYMLGSTLLQLSTECELSSYYNAFILFTNRDTFVNKFGQLNYDILEGMLNPQNKRLYIDQIEVMLNNKIAPESDNYHDICRQKVIEDCKNEQTYEFYKKIVEIYNKENKTSDPYLSDAENKFGLLDSLLLRYIQQSYGVSYNTADFISKCFVEFPKDKTAFEWDNLVCGLDFTEVNDLLPRICKNNLWETFNFHFMMCEDCIDFVKQQDFDLDTQTKKPKLEI